MGVLDVPGYSRAAADSRFATAGSVAVPYSLAKRGYPIKSRPVSKTIAYFGATGHGWTGSSGTVNLNDTTQQMLGTQSISMSATNGAQAGIDSPTLTPFSVVGKNIRIALRYSGSLTGILVYIASDSGLVNRLNKNFYLSALLPTDQDIVIEISAKEFASASGTIDLTNIVKMRVLAQTSSAGQVWIGGIYLVNDATANLPNGAIVLSADDGSLDHWTYLRPKLAAVGGTCTLYPNLDVLQNGNPATYYTAAQAQYMQNVHGFEFASHCVDVAHHVDHVGQTEAWLRNHFESIVAANSGLGFRGNSFAWPNTTSDVLARRVAGDYFRSARGGSPAAVEVHPPSDPLNVRAINMATAGITTTKAYLDTARAAHGVARVFIHAMPVTVSGGTDTARAEVLSLIDYAVSLGMPFMTESQAIDLPVV